MSGAMWWIAQQLLRSAVNRKKAPRNPNPPGNIHQGSTTDAVLCVLERNAPRYMSYAQIVDCTGHTPKSVSWSLCYLKSLDRIEARPSGDPRSSLYKIYRIKRGGNGQ